MTQEEKELLLKDLCARLPYGVKINCFDVPRTLETISIDYEGFVTIDCGNEHFYHPLSNILHKDCLPFLRPMSSMTEKEKNHLQSLHNIISDENYEDAYSPAAWETISEFNDYCYEHHLDNRGLIPMGLAIEAPEGMY